MNKLIKQVLTIIAVVAVVYFGNKGVQTYLGTQAVNSLPFEIHTLDEAKAKAAKEGKLVLADYSAIWCPSCRRLDEEVFTHQMVAASINEDFIYTRLDYDSAEGAEFAKTHGLVGFPRVLVLDTKGNKLVEMPLTFEPIDYASNLVKASGAYLNGTDVSSIN